MEDDLYEDLGDGLEGVEIGEASDGKKVFILKDDIESDDPERQENLKEIMKILEPILKKKSQ